MRLPIHLQREIARMHYYDPSLSNRAIGRTLGISSGPVQALRCSIRQAAIPWSELEMLDDAGWVARLGTKDRSIAQRKPAPDWEWVHQEMQRDDATLERLWREWKEGNPDGINYTRFTELYSEWRNGLNVVMRRIHKPGEKLFVDFAGRTVEIRDPRGGPPMRAQIFVAVLGYSNYTYIEAVENQSTENWVKCHINCFEALNGVPNWVVSDNLKAAVLRRDKGQIVINPKYRDCLRHYDTAPLPTGVRKPKHKAKAEVGVQIAQRWVLFALRDRVFFSLEELNAELRQRTDHLNTHPFKKLPGCRRDRYLESDLPALKPLPATAYEPCDWRYAVRVGKDYHLEHAGCYYSVPSRYAGNRVDYRFTSSTIEVFHQGRRIALHALLSSAGAVSTMPEHQPVAHQRVLEGEPKALLAWAQSIGPNTFSIIRFHLEGRSDMANGLKTTRRLRDLAQVYGGDRLEEVCAYARPLNITSLRSITSIITSRADKRPREQSPSVVRPVGNLRGSNYYGEKA